jgi:glycosyltransferase involved in cell wall biosynthesis
MRCVRSGPRAAFVYAAPTAVIAVSTATAKVLQQGGVDPARIRVVPDAVDEHRVRPTCDRTAARQSLRLSADDFVVLALGKLSEGKGLDLLVRAAAQLPGVRVLLAGDGPRRAALQGLAAELGLVDRVDLLGVRADVGDLLQACDVLAMPSRHEGLGNAAMEAMHIGRPVVAAAVGGLADLVRHEESGLSFPVGDVDALAAQLRRLREDPSLGARLIAGGHRRLDEGMPMGRLLAAHLDVYQRLVGVRGR